MPSTAFQSASPPFCTPPRCTLLSSPLCPPFSVHLTGDWGAGMCGDLTQCGGRPLAGAPPRCGLPGERVAATARPDARARAGRGLPACRCGRGRALSPHVEPSIEVSVMLGRPTLRAVEAPCVRRVVETHRIRITVILVNAKFSHIKYLSSFRDYGRAEPQDVVVEPPMLQRTLRAGCMASARRAVVSVHAARGARGALSASSRAVLGAWRAVEAFGAGGSAGVEMPKCRVAGVQECLVA